MEYIRLTSEAALANALKNLDRKIDAVATKGSGQIIVTDPITGTETIIGELSDGSVGFDQFVGDTEPPPVATMPFVTSQPGTYTITWNGQFVDNAEKPRDFTHLNVIGHKMDGTSTLISMPVGVIRLPTESVLVGLDIADPGDLWQFSLEAVDYTGNKAIESTRSETVIMQNSIASIELVENAIDDLDDKYDAIILESSQLDSRLSAAEIDLTAHDGRLADAELDLSEAFGQLSTVDTRVETARQAAIDAATTAAALDATAKAEQAEADAAAAAAIDAQEKADAAEAAAIAAAQTYADTQASGASAEAIAAAAIDAQEKADAAEAAAIAAAALDATAKAEQAEADAALTAQTKATAAETAAKAYADAQVELAKFAAITAQAYSINPSFDDWSGSLPVGFINYGTGPTKETAIKYFPSGFSAKFNCTDTTTQRGYNFNGILDHAPNLEYWTIEVIFRLESGTLSGSGVLLDWNGLTNNRAVLVLKDEVPTPDLGKWYKIVKTVRRPTNATGTFTGMDGYLMANYASNGLGALTVKNLIVDWLNIRPATAEEINAGLALTMAGSKSRVYYNTGVATGVATADGDLWRQRDASNNIIAEWRWNGTPPAGSWVQTAISSTALSNVDIGKLTAGSATMLQATIDALVANTAAFQTVDVKNLFATTGTLDEAVIDKLWAEVVNAYAITANMLLISNGSNLIPWDPTDVLPHTPWSSSTVSPTNDADLGQCLSVINNTVVPGTFLTILRLCSGQSAVNNRQNAFSVVEGEQMRIEIGVGAGGTYTNGTPTCRVYVQFHGPTGTFIAGYTGIASTLSYSSTPTFAVADTIVPNGATSMDIYLQSDAPGLVFVHQPSMRKKASSVLIEGGAVTADKLESNLVLTSKVIAGPETSTHAEMSPEGFKVFAEDAETGLAYETVRMGVADTSDLLSITNATGESVINLDSMGTVAAKSIEAENTLYYKGEELATYVGSRPKGMVAWAQIPITTNMSVNNGIIGLFELAFDGGDIPARMYELNVNTFIANVTGTGTTGMRIFYTTDGTAPTINSATIQYNYTRVAASGFVSMGGSRIIGSNNGNYIRVLVAMYSNSQATVTLDANQTHLYATVMDLGETIPPTGVATTGGGTPYTGSTVPPPTTAKVTKTVEYGYTSVKSYLPNDSQYVYNIGKAYQGLSPAGFGNLRSIYSFNQDFQSLLSGATIEGVWVYCYFEHWYYNAGGTAKFRFHNQSGAPATYTGVTGNGMDSGGWPKAAGRWVNVPSSLWAGFASGAYKGFALIGDSTYTTYGIANNARLKFKYTK